MRAHESILCLTIQPQAPQESDQRTWQVDQLEAMQALRGLGVYQLPQRRGSRATPARRHACAHLGRCERTRSCLVHLHGGVLLVFAILQTGPMRSQRRWESVGSGVRITVVKAQRLQRHVNHAHVADDGLRHLHSEDLEVEEGRISQEEVREKCVEGSGGVGCRLGSQRSRARQRRHAVTAWDAVCCIQQDIAAGFRLLGLSQREGAEMDRGECFC